MTHFLQRKIKLKSLSKQNDHSFQSFSPSNINSIEDHRFESHFALVLVKRRNSFTKLSLNAYFFPTMQVTNLPDSKPARCDPCSWCWSSTAASSLARWSCHRVGSVLNQKYETWYIFTPCIKFNIKYSLFFVLSEVLLDAQKLQNISWMRKLSTKSSQEGIENWKLQISTILFTPFILFIYHDANENCIYYH